MSHIFLSYARSDAACANRLADLLGRAGHQVWWDRELHGGSRFASEIDKALADAEAVVVLWSETSIDSAWVQDEAAEGRDSGRLVPVVIDNVRPPLGFRQYQSIELVDLRGEDDPAQLGDLIRAVAKLDSGKGQALADAAEKKVEQAKGKSVLVLPFVNMSGDKEQEYFSDGITEDIITDLSKVSALFVIARNTAFTFKGRVIDVKELAGALGVSHVLEGSVRKAGDRVRITAQLIDADTAGHVWADRFDRDLTDIFAIQDEISKAIVSALKVKLLPAERQAIEARGTTSVEAYNLYLMARQQWITGSAGDIRRDETIVRICKQALTFDPDYAHAWALMALAQSQLRLWHARDEDPLPAAEKALALDPGIAEARCVKAHMLEEQGRQDEAIVEIEMALRSNPDSWEVNREAARLLFRQGKIKDAIPYFEKATTLVDTDWHNAGMLTTCYHETGDEDLLRKAARMTVDRVEKALVKDPSNASALASGAGALATLGENQKASDWIDRALLLDPDNILMRYNLACVLAKDIQDGKRAMDVITPYFERTVSRTQLRHADVAPDLDPIREEPDFVAMMHAAKQRLDRAEGAAG